MNIRSPEENTTLKRNIVRKLSLGLNLSSLYPTHHPEVRVSASAVKDVLTEYFEFEKEFSLGVGIKGWNLKDTDLTRENIQFGATARELHRRGVSVITLYPDIGENTLLHFFQLVSLSLEEVDSRGGLIRLLSEVSLPSINLFSLNYDKLLDSILNNIESLELLINEKAWPSIIHRFLSDPKAFSDPPGEKKTKRESLSSEELALMLNQIHKQMGSENTEKVVNFLQTLGDKCLSEGMSVDPNREKFCQLISQLNPDLLQKTAHSLKNIQKRKEMHFNDRLLTTLNLFSTESVHQSLFLRTEPEKLNVSQMQDWHPEETKNLQEMFENRPAESSASATYKRSLSKMIERTKQLLQNNVSVRRENILKEISPENIKLHSLRIILDLMELEKDPVIYLKLLKALNGYFDLLAKKMDIPILLEVCLFLTRHSVKKEDDLIRSSALEALMNLFKGDVILQLSKHWIESSGDKEAMIQKILERLNLSQVATTLKLLLSSRTAETDRQKICTLLSELISQDLTHVEADLISDDARTVTNAISILSKIPNEQAARLLGALLTHPEKRVHQQALDALILQGTQKSLEYLLSVLFSLSPSHFSAAVRSIAVHGKRPVLEQLKKFLISKDIFERTYLKRVEIVALLGEYKNENAIPMLASVFPGKPFFRFKKNTSFRAAILQALSKIGTQDALIALSLLKGTGGTMILMTGNILLEGQKK